ncbi:hypothetical protein B0H67DRAFT_640410 [Lasiosphaeris hirsuta]|uniref:Uncharacterized protein n=1 Tax=Lasiosphaeris hirsuta TaxID=260670 RepID=A0AA40BD61_9PEZI|nr:hypothetical protein B0H67DRAFT_640410 [Lasiosphaeris hirsuta]
MASNISVYVGIWRDHSENGFDQVTLTLPLKWGNIVISGLALLVSMAGGATWRIFAYILHQVRVRHATRSDPFQQQVQTLLRNNVTPISALVDSFWICLAWAQTPYSTVRTLLPTTFIAAFIIACFGLFSILVSTIATRSESYVNVLARPGENCGGWDFNWAAVNFGQSLPVSVESTRAKVDDAQNARAYATWFYSRARQPLAETNTMFPVPRLPYEISKVPCPFLGEARCLSNDTSTPNTTILLDTGLLNSHFHLGINAPPSDRSGVRHRMACSPIDITGMIKLLGEENGYIRFDISEVVNQTDPIIYAADPEPLSTGYSTKCFWWSGAGRHAQWPEKLTMNGDSDITVCFVSQNSVRYSEPVYDPFFLANGTKYSAPFYYGNNYFNVLACEQQVQFCNPVNGLCSNLSHAAKAYEESIAGLNLNPDQSTAIKRSALLLGLTDVGAMGLATLGASGLLARESVFEDTRSLRLSPDQWEKEVRLWFESRLALLQAHIMRFLDRIDTTSPIYERTLVYQPYDSLPPGKERDAVYNSCNNMRITTAGRYQNFRFWVVMIVVIFSVLIVTISVSLEMLMKIVRRIWVTKDGRARQLARDSDSQYWLLRLALEGAGIGPWRRGGEKADSNIPVVDHVQSLSPLSTDYGIDEFQKN